MDESKCCSAPIHPLHLPHSICHDSSGKCEQVWNQSSCLSSLITGGFSELQIFLFFSKTSPSPPSLHHAGMRSPVLDPGISAASLSHWQPANHLKHCPNIVSAWHLPLFCHGAVAEPLQCVRNPRLTPPSALPWSWVPAVCQEPQAVQAPLLSITRSAGVRDIWNCRALLKGHHFCDVQELFPSPQDTSNRCSTAQIHSTLQLEAPSEVQTSQMQRPAGATCSKLPRRSETSTGGDTSAAVSPPRRHQWQSSVETQIRFHQSQRHHVCQHTQIPPLQLLLCILRAAGLLLLLRPCLTSDSKLALHPKFRDLNQSIWICEHKAQAHSQSVHPQRHPVLLELLGE